MSAFTLNVDHWEANEPLDLWKFMVGFWPGRRVAIEPIPPYTAEQKRQHRIGDDDKFDRIFELVGVDSESGCVIFRDVSDEYDTVDLPDTFVSWPLNEGPIVKVRPQDIKQATTW